MRQKISKTQKVKHLKKWTKNFMIAVLLIFIVIFACASIHINRSLTRDKKQELQNIIHVSGQNIEDAFQTTEAFIYETFTDSMDLHNLKYNEDTIEQGIARENISSALKNICAWSGKMDGIVFYSQEREDALIEVGRGKEDYAIRQYIKKNISSRRWLENFNPYGYKIVEVKSKTYILHVMCVQQCYFVSCSSESNMLEPLYALGDGYDYQVYLSEKEEVLENNKYIQIGYASETTGLSFGLLLSKADILASLRDFQVTFVLVFLVFIGLIPLTGYLITRFIEHPISEMAEKMQLVGQGDWETQMENTYNISEYTELIESFNKMVTEIEHLKIANYEAELKYQKSNLQYLQLQIKPHFYVNALNIIFSMAQVRDFETIQKICRALVDYTRYMFHDATSMVSLKKELEHVRDYIEIQKLRYGNYIYYEQDVDEQLEATLIPPFIIQSFVENSIKYGQKHHDILLIQVSAHIDKANEMIYIKIRDNGTGYPQTILEDIENVNKDDGKIHIGLKNVRDRMNVIYGDTAGIHLYNDQGAITELWMPYINM